MSAEVFLAGQPGGNNASVQGTTVGGHKPLHRFLKGQPKIIGIVKLIMGSSLFIVNIAVSPDSHSFVQSAMASGFLVGILFIICGILYIVTEHNPTKKTVTISMALSIVTILAACWTVMHIVPSIIYHLVYSRDYAEDYFGPTDEPPVSFYEAIRSAELVFLLYTVVGGIIAILMTFLAGAALRSSNSQAIVVMTTTAAETPVE
ncbi:membrane-spanning 4-domains subfamily A member 4D-like [Centropristis striata]|uniref:membrane-spanning 4-domains subfamily A member 4D-like n=1 Tax=Centropristis striata TaxID=184440 RepID=UPI0027DF5529|nr:membrane-spanning 4-domains subfamily A member 4D-like [Centropristis striata]